MNRPGAGVPSPPRPVRWSAALARGWVLGLIGAVLSISGLGLLALLHLAGMTGTEDADLDAGALRAFGTVTAIDEHPRRATAIVRFRFRDRTGTERDGFSHAAAPPAVGSRVEVEFLADEPVVSRIVGTRRSQRQVWTDVVLGVAVLPGVLLLMLWLRGALRRKLLLTHGVATDAKVTACTGAGRMRVEYRYTDPSGAEHTGRQRVPAPSPLGRRLAAGERRVTVICDPERPGRAALVDPELFAGAPR